tara:strand:- start:75 stop:431 length:357 start_codon:yes stop_codon:yes gene_type:complete
MDNNKLLYIYNNINDIKNHNDIIKYIKYKNIKYTLNNNGFFVNISCLSDEHVTNIYNIIRYCINNMDNDNTYIDKRKQLILDNINNNNKSNVVNNIISLNEFSEEQQQIINHSKQFKI